MEDFTIMRWETDELTNINKYAKEKEVPVDDDSAMVLMPPFSAAFFKGHSASINGLAISTNDRYLVSCSADSTIIAWEAATGKHVKTIKHINPVIRVAITPDNKYIIGCDDEISTSNLYIWDLITGKLINKTADLYNHYLSVAISNNGKYIVTGMLGKEIILYEFPSLRVIKKMKGHTSWINSIAFSNDNKYIVSGAHDNTLKIWDVASGTLVKDLRKTTLDIDKLCYEKEHQLITTDAVFNDKRVLTTWDIEHNIGLKKTVYIDFQNALDLTFEIADNGKEILTTEDSAIVIYNPSTGKITTKISLPNIGIASIPPDASSIIYQNKKDHALYSINATKKNDFFASYPDDKIVYTMDYSTDGKMLATGDIGANIHLWDVQTKQRINTFNYVDKDSSRRKDGTYSENDLDVSNAWVTSIKFSPDGKLLAAACRFADPLIAWGKIVIWDVATGHITYSRNAHDFQIQSINWSPDGKRIITGSNDKWVKVWDTLSFKKEFTEPLHSYPHDFTAMHTSFTQDGKWIISAGLDGKIMIKDANTYEPIAQLISIDSSDYIAITKEQYYAASKNATKQIAFRQGNKVFPFEQFDLKFNRPDKMLEALGSKDSVMINAYKNAYKKRLKRRGFTEEMLSADLHLPQLQLLNQNSIPLSTNQPNLNIAFDISDDKYALKNYTVLVNGVPFVREKNLDKKIKKLSKQAFH